jgi:hypothetical protein
MGFYTGVLYGYGIQSILLCVLAVALSVASAPIADYSLASSLYADLPIVLTIVHFDGTFILSLHSICMGLANTLTKYNCCNVVCALDLKSF